MPRVRVNRNQRERPERHSDKRPFNILVASSGESSSLGAIRVAAAIARETTASVEVLTVAVPFPHAAPTAFQVAPPTIIDEESRQRAVELVREQLASVRGTREWSVRAATGWAVDAIVDAGRRWPASLLIVGAGEHGILDRLIGSETAVKLARRSTIPVLAVPEHATKLPVHAVAAIDFMETSIEAARTAASLLPATGVLTLAHASALADGSPDPGSLMDVYTAGAAAKLDTLVKRIQAGTECRVERVVLSGDVVSSLLAFAEREHCDLLAVGGEAHDLIDRLLLGSVRADLLRKAQLPVLVVAHMKHGDDV